MEIIVKSTKRSNVWGNDDGTLTLLDYEASPSGIECPVYIYECNKIDNFDVNIGGPYEVIRTTDPGYIAFGGKQSIPNSELPKIIKKYNSHVQKLTSSIPKINEQLLSLSEKRMNKVYIIEDFGGEWSDSWQHTVGIFLDKDTAIKHAEEHWDIQGNFLNKLSIPYKIYNQYIDEFEPFDYDNENLGEDDGPYIFTDAHGYTKEQWEETYRLMNYNDSSYCYTKVTEYDLNKIYPEQNGVWLKYKIEPEQPYMDDYDFSYREDGPFDTTSEL